MGAKLSAWYGEKSTKGGLAALIIAAGYIGANLMVGNGWNESHYGVAPSALIYGALPLLAFGKALPELLSKAKTGN